MNNQSNLVFSTALDNDTELSLTYLLEEATILVKDLLQQFANEPDFPDRMQLAFGENTDGSQLRSSWQAGEFVFPQIEVVAASDINGANGAFASQTNKIYLAQQFLLANQSKIDVVAAVLLEEYGHFIDSEINPVDSPGDEGAIFTEVVQGNLLGDAELQALKIENDLTTVEIDNQILELENNQELPYLRVDYNHIKLTNLNKEDILFTYDISGNKIVWSKSDGNDYEIYLYENGKTIQLTNNDYEDIYPSVSDNEFGSVIAWDTQPTLDQIRTKNYDDSRLDVDGIKFYDGTNVHDLDDLLRDSNGNYKYKYTDYSGDTNSIYGYRYPFSPPISTFGNKIAWQGHDFDTIYIFDGNQSTGIDVNQLVRDLLFDEKITLNDGRFQYWEIIQFGFYKSVDGNAKIAICVIDDSNDLVLLLSDENYENFSAIFEEENFSDPEYFIENFLYNITRDDALFSFSDNAISVLDDTGIYTSNPPPRRIISYLNDEFKDLKSPQVLMTDAFSSSSYFLDAFDFDPFDGDVQNLVFGNMGRIFAYNGENFRSLNVKWDSKNEEYYTDPVLYTDFNDSNYYDSPKISGDKVVWSSADALWLTTDVFSVEPEDDDKPDDDKPDDDGDDDDDKPKKKGITFIDRVSRVKEGDTAVVRLKRQGDINVEKTVEIQLTNPFINVNEDEISEDKIIAYGMPLVGPIIDVLLTTISKGKPSLGKGGNVITTTGLLTGIFSAEVSHRGAILENSVATDEDFSIVWQNNSLPLFVSSLNDKFPIEVTFAPGETETTLEINTKDDDVVECTHGAFLEIPNQDRSLFIIRDNDDPDAEYWTKELFKSWYSIDTITNIFIGAVGNVLTGRVTLPELLISAVLTTISSTASSFLTKMLGCANASIILEDFGDSFSKESSTPTSNQSLSLTTGDTSLSSNSLSLVTNSTDSQVSLNNNSKEIEIPVNFVPEIKNDNGDFVVKTDDNQLFLVTDFISEEEPFSSQQIELDGVTDINSSSKVTGFILIGEEINAAIWDNGTVIPIAINSQSAAVAINDAGQIIINSVNDDGLAQAYLYDLAEEKFIPITNLDSATSTENGAYVVDINNNGQVLGYGLTPEGNLEAFIWKDNSLEFLGTLGGLLSIPIAINDAGDVIGISETSTSEQLTGFIYKDGTINNLDAGQGFITLPKAFNENGEVVGIYAPIEDKFADPNLSGAFLWSEGELTDLGSLGGSGTLPLDINNEGKIIALSENAEEEIESVLWDSGDLKILEQVAVSFDGEGNTIDLINQVDQAADLSVVQTASSESVLAGEEITYTFTITNDGAHDAQGVQLAYTLPEGATFVSATTTPAEQSENNLTFDLGDLADEESTTVDITINASSLVGESFSNAQVTSNTYDPNDDNNLASVSTNIEPISELLIDDVSLPEANDGKTDFTFTVALDEVSTETVIVDYATADDSAIAGEDYTATNGTLEFAPGETEQTITVEVLNDSDFEVDEAFQVNLSNPTNANISDAQGIGIITNEEVDSLAPTSDTPLVGKLDNSDDSYTYKDKKYYYDFYALPVDSTIGSGDTIEITLTSDNFEPMLMLLNSQGDVIEHNHGSTEESTTAKLSYLVESESFFVSIETMNANTIGDYQLEVNVI